MYFPPLSHNQLIKRIAGSAPAFWAVTLIFLLGLAGCAKQEDSGAHVDKDSFHYTYANAIEEAHNVSVWEKKDAFKADIEVTFGEQAILQGTLTTEMNSVRTRLVISEDTVAVFDGKDIWVAPNDTAINRVDFHLKTWPYFLKAPYKLLDPGTKLEDLGTDSLTGDLYDTARLTFEPGTGDTPDDWYVLYRDTESNRLHAMAYIVTYGKSVEEANEEPHAITYEGIVELEGVPVPTVWNFWIWDEENGISGEPIGKVTISNPEFIEASDQLFAAPEGG